MRFKYWLILSVLLFCGGLVWGLTTSVDSSSVLAGDVVAFEEFAGNLTSLSPGVTFLFILLKNVLALVMSFILSPIFLLVPILALVLNGGLLGFVSAIVIREKSLTYLLSGLLPHGIFELPAFFIGEAAAFSFGMAVILAVFSKNRRELLLPSLRRNVKYLLLSFALLVPAAFIETFLTPLLLGK